MTNETYSAGDEPVHTSSQTDHALTELQLYGWRPFQDEPDPRPLPEGNTAASALRRLRKAAPALHERVLTGDLSPHAAMLEAGFRRKTMQLPTDPEGVARALLRKFWTAEPVTHHGPHHRFDAVRIHPAPQQPGGPPIFGQGPPASTQRSKSASPRNSCGKEVPSL